MLNIKPLDLPELFFHNFFTTINFSRRTILLTDPLVPPLNLCHPANTSQTPYHSTSTSLSTPLTSHNGCRRIMCKSHVPFSLLNNMICKVSVTNPPLHRLNQSSRPSAVASWPSSTASAQSSWPSSTASSPSLTSSSAASPATAPEDAEGTAVVGGALYRSFYRRENAQLHDANL